MTTPSIYDARVLLPGLKLTQSKDVVVPDDVKALTSDGSMLVFLKKFDGNLSLFRDHNMFLEAVYENRETPPATPAIETLNFEEVDDGGWGPDPDPWEEKRGDTFIERPYENILIEEWEWARKRIDSPSIEGYDSFLLKPNDVWKSSDKKIQTIDLCFFLTETDVMPSASLDFSQNRGVEIGEEFKLDVTGDSNPSVVVLEWDFSCIIMKEVASPREEEVLKRETEIADEILLLGMHGGQRLDPSELLHVNVHLADYVTGGYSNLKLKLYDNCAIKGDQTKTFDDMVDSCIQNSCTSCAAIGSFSASDVSGNYVKFEIDPKTLLQMVSSQGSENVLVSLLNQDEDPPVQTIIDAIEAAQFAAVIEDGNSGENVAEFLLASIASNNIYFDSAVQMLKAPTDTSHEKITDWSKMVTRTAQSIWDSLYTQGDYKVTRSDSIDLNGADSALQEYVLRFALPNVNTDLATIDPYNDISILVENCDSGLSFVGRDENREFLYLNNPVTLEMSGDDHVMEFKWKAMDMSGTERESEVKVSFLVGINGRRPTKIGRTVSILRNVGGVSKKHLATVRLRHMVKLGFESATDIECCFSHFIERTFKMVFAFSSSQGPSLSGRIFLEKAADDISSQFYKAVANRGQSDIYNIIENSPVFSREFMRNGEDLLETAREINESELAEFIREIFNALGTYELSEWAASMKDDEDALNMAEGDVTIDDLIQAQVENLRRVLQMDSAELTLQLQQHPGVMQDFISAARLVRSEIDGPVTMAQAMDMQGSELAGMLNESSAKKIDVQTQEILAGLEEQVQSSVFSEEQFDDPQVLMENVSAMETNLLQMLENTAECCDTGMAYIDGFQGGLEEISGLLESLRNFGSNISTLSSNASNLVNFVKRFWEAFKLLANISIGPLAVIKTIVNGIKVPMKLILDALDGGVNKIKTLAYNVDKKLRTLVTKNMVNKINGLSEKAEKPKPGLEKVMEIVDMLISVAQLGVLPMSLISKFASSNSLETFFQTLTGSISTVKTSLNSVYDQTTRIQPFLTRMRDLSQSVSSKFNFISPLNGYLEMFQPYIDKIKWAFDKFTGWWAYLLEGAMWPIEQAINALVSPFRSQINSMIASLNPFGAIDAIVANVVSPLNLLPSDVTLTGGLDSILSLTSVSGMQQKYGNEFKVMTDSVTLCVAMIQRGFYGLLEGLFMQAANNVDAIRDLMGEDFAVIEEILQVLQIESPDATLGDAVLELNKSIGGPIAKIDSYLSMYASNNGHTFKDGFTTDLCKSYLSTSDYELTHCAINTSQDASSALFECGKTSDGNPKNSWMISAIAALLHYRKVTEQAEKIGILSPENTVRTPFMPVHQGSGQYRVSLYPRIDGSMQVFDVDSRLPITKRQLVLGSIEDFPLDVFNYANNRILAEVNPVFSRKHALALVEKVTAFKLNIAATESVGTAMHFLSGKSSGYCYKRGSETNQWMQYVGNGADNDAGKYDTLAMVSTGDVAQSDEELIALLKQRTMSKEQVELLDTLYNKSLSDEESNIIASDRANIAGAVQELSMFVLVAPSSGIAHPVLYTDKTPQGNIVFANGSNIRPLFDLSNVSEVWEYPITGISSSQAIGVSSIKQENSIGEVSIQVASIGDEDRDGRGRGGRGGPGDRGNRRSIDEFEEPATDRIGKDIDLGITTVISENDSTLKMAAGDTSMVEIAFGYITGEGQFAQKIKECSAKLQEVIAANRIGSSREIKINDYIFSKTYGDKGGKVAEIMYEPATKTKPSGTQRVKEYKVKKLTSPGGSLPTPAEYTIAPNMVLQHKVENEVRRMEDPNISRFDRILPDNLSYGNTKDVNKRKATFEAAEIRRKNTFWTSDRTRTLGNSKYWGITVTELKRYVEVCKLLYPSTWSKLHYSAPNRGYVSVNNFTEAFIKRHTKASGNCLALDLNSSLIDPAKSLRPAEVFVSVSWDEDIEQLATLLYNQATKESFRLNSSSMFNTSTMIWIAPFSLHQKATGSSGPSLEEQLQIGVFNHVIQSVDAFFGIQTSVCDPYSRLWCVSELAEAIGKEKKIKQILSADWKARYTREKGFGYSFQWDEVDEVYKKFLYRNDNSPWTTKMLKEKKEFEKLRTPRYFLMEREEWAHRKNSGTLNAQPILRLNVENGLRKGSSSPRAVDNGEFKRLDGTNTLDMEFWWKMQNKIIEFQEKAANTTPFEEHFSLMYKFEQQYEPGIGSNTDCIRRALRDPEILATAQSKFGSSWTYKLAPLDAKGRAFLEFKDDNEAITFFKEAMGLRDVYEPNEKSLLSFGANGDLLGLDKHKFGFHKIEELAIKDGCTYVDSMKLPPLAASYKLKPEADSVAHPRNVFWQEYYKKAMVKAERMTIILSNGWFNSYNCWEELEWAADLRNCDREGEVLKVKTLIAFTKRSIFDELEKNQTIVRYRYDGKFGEWNWNELKAKIIGFDPTAPIIVNDMAQVEAEINKFYAA